MRTIQEALALYLHTGAGKRQLEAGDAADQREPLPEGSRWYPGSPGDPACLTCKGTGHLRLELPLNALTYVTDFRCPCVLRMREKRRGHVEGAILR
jgi:hypothetical protein